jgi:hypothetical protein
MLRIGFKRDLHRVKIFPIEIIEKVSKITNILEKYYGERRDIDKDMGGYILLIENNCDFEQLNNELYMDISNDVIPEFVDLIKCSDGQVYTHTLILCNNDFGISIFMPFEITPDNLKEYIEE